MMDDVPNGRIEMLLKMPFSSVKLYLLQLTFLCSQLVPGRGWASSFQAGDSRNARFKVAG